jgi:hypothetical protein
MTRVTPLAGLVVVWLVIEGLLYWLVPGLLSMTNFIFISAVLLLLVVVVAAKWRPVATHESMTDVLYEMDHPRERKP